MASESKSPTDTKAPDAKQTANPEGTGSSDQSIGRPGNWREGRYQQRGEPIDQSVNKPSESTAEPHDTVGTQTPPATGRDNAATRQPPKDQAPVTRKDYE